MKLKDNVIKAALALLNNRNNGIVNVKNGMVKDEAYDGYVASFGPSVVQADVLATILAYAGDEKKKLIVNGIFRIYKEAFDSTAPEQEAKAFVTSRWQNAAFDKADFRKKIVDCSVALKLALRTYRKPDRE